MNNATLIKKLIADGFDSSFAKKAVSWVGVTCSPDFRRSLADPVRFIRDNEYLIRTW